MQYIYIHTYNTIIYIYNWMMCLVNKTYLDIICSLNIYVYRNALMFIYDIYYIYVIICYRLLSYITYISELVTCTTNLACTHLHTLFPFLRLCEHSTAGVRPSERVKATLSSPTQATLVTEVLEWRSSDLWCTCDIVAFDFLWHWSPVNEHHQLEALHICWVMWGSPLRSQRLGEQAE